MIGLADRVVAALRWRRRWQRRMAQHGGRGAAAATGGERQSLLRLMLNGEAMPDRNVVIAIEIHFWVECWSPASFSSLEVCKKFEPN